MHIEQELVFLAPAKQLWSLLGDLPGMAECIPGAENVQAVDPQQLTLRVKVKVGPIAVGFDCQVKIMRLDHDALTGAFEITGRDARVGAGLRAVSTFTLHENRPHTTVTLDTDTDISGKIAQYGHGIIRQRADAILQAFGECLRARLARATA
ncbi:MAG: hypothetical protein NVSMB2_01160 [Chloroflexota bacterium]